MAPPSKKKRTPEVPPAKMESTTKAPPSKKKRARKTPSSETELTPEIPPAKIEPNLMYPPSKIESTPMAPPSKKNSKSAPSKTELTSEIPPAKTESTPMNNPPSKKKRTSKAVPPKTESTSEVPNAKLESPMMAPPSKKKKNQKVPPAETESTSMSPPVETESTPLAPPSKKKKNPKAPPAETESTPLAPPSKKKKNSKVPPAEIESTPLAPPSKKKKNPKAPPAEIESTPLAPPSKKKKNSKVPPAEIESTPLARPSKKKKNSKVPPAEIESTPLAPPAETESTPLAPPSKKKKNPKAPPAKTESTSVVSTSKEESTLMSLVSPANKKAIPAASSLSAVLSFTRPLSEAQIQGTLDRLQLETIHSYKCKEKKLKDLKAMNEMITMYPHRLEQPNAFYNNRGRTSLYLNNEMPNLITPLADAACRGHLKCAEILLSRGASIHALSVGGQGGRGITILETLMLWSKIPNHHDILALLVSHGASPLPCDNNGRDLLYEAVKLGEVETVKFMLEHGLDPCAGKFLNPSRKSCLQEAFFSFNFDIVKLLLLYNASLKRNTWQHGRSNKNCTVPELLVDNIISTTGTWYFYEEKNGRIVATEKAPQRLLMSMKLYHIFGGRLGNILGYLNSVQNGELFNKIQGDLQELISHPLNLKSLARLVVKKCMGQNYMKNIKNLEVAHDVEKLLRFEDVAIECC